MPIKQPITSNKDPNDHRATWLHFEGGGKLKFYMRGSIAWPEGSQEGFATMAGIELLSGKIIVFDQFRFWTIEHMLNPDGTIKKREDGDGWQLGLIQFILDCVKKYSCCTFFHGGQQIDVARRHLIMVYKNAMLPRYAQFVEVPYVSEVGDDLIREKTKLRQYVVQERTPLAESIKQWINMQASGTGDSNAVHALRCLLAGLSFQPYVELKTIIKD